MQANLGMQGASDTSNSVYNLVQQHNSDLLGERVLRIKENL